MRLSQSRKAAKGCEEIFAQSMHKHAKKTAREEAKTRRKTTQSPDSYAPLPDSPLRVAGHTWPHKKRTRVCALQSLPFAPLRRLLAVSPQVARRERGLIRP